MDTLVHAQYERRQRSPGVVARGGCGELIAIALRFGDREVVNEGEIAVIDERVAV